MKLHSLHGQSALCDIPQEMHAPTTNGCLAISNDLTIAESGNVAHHVLIPIHGEQLSRKGISCHAPYDEHLDLLCRLPWGTLVREVQGPVRMPRRSRPRLQSCLTLPTSAHRPQVSATPSHTLS